MSMSLSSATITNLAAASINDLAGSTLDAGSGDDNETPSGGGSCVWSAANVTTILNALSALQRDVAEIKAKTDNLPASPAAAGSAMALTDAYAEQLAKIFALLANWSISNNELTATVGSTAYKFTLTKNDDDIIGVTPASQS